MRSASVTSELTTEAMQTLDVLEVLASRPGGEHLRSRVTEARAMVRRERPQKRKKQEVPVPPKA